MIKKKLYSTHTDDLNIQLAWAELSQLCQCGSPIQEGKFYILKDKLRNNLIILIIF